MMNYDQLLITNVMKSRSFAVLLQHDLTKEQRDGITLGACIALREAPLTCARRVEYGEELKLYEEREESARTAADAREQRMIAEEATRHLIEVMGRLRRAVAKKLSHARICQSITERFNEKVAEKKRFAAATVEEDDTILVAATDDDSDQVYACPCIAAQSDKNHCDYEKEYDRRNRREELRAIDFTHLRRRMTTVILGRLHSAADARQSTEVTKKET